MYFILFRNKVHSEIKVHFEIFVLYAIILVSKPFINH